MGKRGKRSLAELETMVNATADANMRPDAPYTLTDTEADHWRAIVNAMKPGYFAPTQHKMLEQLCRHFVQADRIAQLIEAECKKKSMDTRVYADLLKMQSGESMSIGRLMRHMRLNHKSLIRADSTKHRPMLTIHSNSTEAPWHRDDE